MASTSRARSASKGSAEIAVTDGLAQLSFLIQESLARCTATYELSLSQTRLLGVLRDREPTMNELAKLLGLDKSSISGLVERAERRGLVSRVSSMSDRRKVSVVLTDEARSIVTEISRRFSSDVSSLLELVPPFDRMTLSRIVNRLLVANAAAHGVDLFETVVAES